MLFFMKLQKISSPSSRQEEFARLRTQLAETGWISEG